MEIRPCASFCLPFPASCPVSRLSGSMPRWLRACLPYPHSLERPTKALDENTDARGHARHGYAVARPSQDMSFINQKLVVSPERTVRERFAYSSRSEPAGAPTGSPQSSQNANILPNPPAMRKREFRERAALRPSRRPEASSSICISSSCIQILR